MPAITGSNLGLNHSWPLGESGWDTGNNTNLKTLDATVLLSVLSATTPTPPVSPTVGDRYIIATSATGDWLGLDGQLAVWNDAGIAWEFYVPKSGWFCRADDSRQVYVYDTGAWVLEGSLYGQYADDTAAATASVPVGGFYVNSATGAVSVRLV